MTARKKTGHDVHDWSDKVLHWMDANKKQLGIYFGALVLLVALVLGAVTWWNNYSDQAANMLYEAELSIDNNEAQGTGLESLREKYPWSGSADVAALRLGDLAFDKGEYAKAIDYYKEVANVSDRKALLRTMVWMNIAKTYEAMNDYESAVSYYMRAFNDESNALRGHAYFSAAGCYEAQGKYAQAKEIYQSFLNTNDYATPTLKRESEDRLIWIASTEK